MRAIGSTTRTRDIAKAARWRRWQGNGESKVAPRTAIVPRMLCDTFLDSGRVFGYNPQMKTQIIEIDDDTAMALKQRAAERGLSVPELVAELVTLEAGPGHAALDGLTLLCCRPEEVVGPDYISPKV